MTRAEEGLKSPQVQAALQLRIPVAREWFRQINFYMTRGPGCNYLKTALRLRVSDLTRLGFNCSDGIVAPDGERLWPMS